MNLKELLEKQEKHSLILSEINFLKDVLIAVDNYDLNVKGLQAKEKEYEVMQQQLNDDSISVKEYNNLILRCKIAFYELLDLEEKIQIVEELQKSKQT